MSWEIQPPPINEGEDELQLKLQYARMVARNPRERFTGGYKIFPGEHDYGRALQVQAWYFDQIVQDEIGRLTVGDEDDDPQEQFETEVMNRARQADDREAIGFYKLAAELKGYVQKGGTNINVNQDNRVVNVLRVPTRDITPEDDADFNEKFYAQQTKLIADARSNRPIAA